MNNMPITLELLHRNKKPIWHLFFILSYLLLIDTNKTTLDLEPDDP